MKRPFCSPKLEAQAPAAKRRKLKGYDLLPSQALQSMGASAVENVSLQQLFQLCQKRNKACAFFSEFCDSSPERQGVIVGLCEGA